MNMFSLLVGVIEGTAWLLVVSMHKILTESLANQNCGHSGIMLEYFANIFDLTMKI